MIKKKKYEESIKIMRDNIASYTDDLWTPHNELKMKNIKINSWFSILESNEYKNHFVEHDYKTKVLDTQKYRCKKITLFLNRHQKNLLNNWLNSYALMYNEAVKYIKNNINVDSIIAELIANKKEYAEKMMKLNAAKKEKKAIDRENKKNAEKARKIEKKTKKEAEKQANTNARKIANKDKQDAQKAEKAKKIEEKAKKQAIKEANTNAQKNANKVKEANLKAEKQAIKEANTNARKIANKVKEDDMNAEKKADKNKSSDLVNFMYVRQKLGKEKKKILEKSNGLKKSKIKVHDIDGAIKLACAMFKSAITNKMNGHIDKFRIRYWKSKKESKIMDLEKANFSSAGIRANILGPIEGSYNGEAFDFKTIECDCKLQKIRNRYYLYIPEKIKMDDKSNKPNKQITIDPGIRTFMTGITENKVIKIIDKKKRIKKYLKRKDKIMGNEKIPENIKKKNEKMINRKISNIIEDFHWKSIKYLTDNNAIILMGNMSTKNIISKTGNLDRMSKRIGMAMRLYKFKQRLEYKCALKRVKYGEINEWNTSKMCSKCGNINHKLGGNKIYECSNCKVIMDRDVNGARNIYIKAIIK